MCGLNRAIPWESGPGGRPAHCGHATYSARCRPRRGRQPWRWPSGWRIWGQPRRGNQWQSRSGGSSLWRRERCPQAVRRRIETTGPRRAATRCGAPYCQSRADDEPASGASAARCGKRPRCKNPSLSQPARSSPIGLSGEWDRSRRIAPRRRSEHKRPPRNSWSAAHRTRRCSRGLGSSIWGEPRNR